MVAASPQVIKKGRGWRRRLCRRVVVRFAQGAGKEVLRIDRPLAGGFLGLTAFQAEGCGIALSGDEFYNAAFGGFAADKKRGRGWRRRLCRRVVVRFAQGAGKEVLRIDRPLAGGFLSLTAFQVEGCGIALSVHSEHILKER